MSVPKLSIMLLKSVSFFHPAPQVSPENFHLVPRTLNATSAQFGWDEVDEYNATVIRGHFKGYQVRHRMRLPGAFQRLTGRA